MRGQLYKRRNSWTIRVAAGRDPESGKRQIINRTVHGTKKEAEQVRVALLRQLDQGELLLKPTRLTMREYLEEWKAKAARPRVSPRTFHDYEGMLERYVTPVLGTRRLSAITPMDVQDVIARMLARGLSSRTVRYCHTVLNNALRQAVRWRYLSHNPAREVELPRRERREMLALTEQEAQRFLAAAASSIHHALFALLLGTGLRPGEAVALKWTDLDAANDRLIIRRSVSSGKGGMRLQEPKTAQGRRTVELPHHLTRLLMERKGDADEQDFIFPSKAGTPLDVRNLASKHFKPTLTKAGLPSKFRLYDLRHTHATLLLLAGVNPKIVSERLGHAGVMITLDVYSHVLPGMQSAAAAKLDAMLFGSPPEPRARGDLAN